MPETPPSPRYTSPLDAGRPRPARRYTPAGEQPVAAIDPSAPRSTPAAPPRLRPARRYTPLPVPARSAARQPTQASDEPVEFTNADLFDPSAAAQRVVRRFSVRDPEQTLSRALDVVFGLEGGYANHPADRGGRTIYGISERAYPDLWKEGPPSKDQATEAYRALWRDSGAERIAGLKVGGSDRLAMALFDAAVHHGPQRAAILLQRAAGGGLKQDGAVGDKTLSMIEERLRHDAKGKSLVGDLAKERLRFFNRIVRNDPSQREFLEGWNARLVKLHDQLR